MSQAKKIMQPFVLRRLKKDVLKDLPKKTEEIIYCEMIEKQKFKYENLISTFSKKTENKNVSIIIIIIINMESMSIIFTFFVLF